MILREVAIKNRCLQSHFLLLHRLPLVIPTIPCRFFCFGSPAHAVLTFACETVILHHRGLAVKGFSIFYRISFHFAFWKAPARCLTRFAYCLTISFSQATRQDFTPPTAVCQGDLKKQNGPIAKFAIGPFIDRLALAPWQERGEDQHQQPHRANSNEGIRHHVAHGAERIQ